MFHRRQPRGSRTHTDRPRGHNTKQSESRLKRGAEHTPIQQRRLYAGCSAESRLRAASTKALKRGLGEGAWVARFAARSAPARRRAMFWRWMAREMRRRWWVWKERVAERARP